jgi:hypothetical protein
MRAVAVDRKRLRTGTGCSSFDLGHSLDNCRRSSIGKRGPIMVHDKRWTSGNNGSMTESLPPASDDHTTELPRRRPWDVPPGIAAILAAVIAAAGFVVGTVTTRGSAVNPSPSPTVTVTTLPPPSDLGFALAQQAQIPWCSTLTGSGKIPKGYALVIFDAAETTTLYYHLDGVATQTSSDAWSLSPFYIGERHETGLRDQIVAVVVPSQTAAFIQNVLAIPPGKAWVANALPAGPHIYVNVSRDAGAAQCATT